MNRIDSSLLKLLVCPACRTSVLEAGDSLLCSNSSCGLAYPVRNDVPIMLVEEASQSKGSSPCAAAAD
ncbi:MAG: Trm112 family protein [bacterium]